MTMDATVVKATENLNALIAEVADAVEERDDVLKAVTLALVSKNHAFLYGAPGTGKSMSARLFFQGIEDCKIFSKQITRQMTEEAVFGPLDIQSWRAKGEYKYKTKGGASESDICLFEEYFDGSDGLIRAMNELLNEREFTRSIGDVLKCPLHTAIGTSNFWRAEGDAQAVSDRFLCRVEVKALEEGTSRQDMIRSYINNQAPKIKSRLSFDEIKTLSEARKNVTVDDDVIDGYEQMFVEYRNALGKRVYLSDRRLAWASILIQSNALLDGRTAAGIDDIGASKYGLVFIGKDEEEDAFQRAHDKIVGVMATKIKAKRDLDTFHQTIKRATKKLESADSQTLIRLHHDLMTVKSGLATRPNSGIKDIEDQFKKLEEDMRELISEIGKKIQPSDLKAIL